MQISFPNPRQSGRTTRMLEEAINAIIQAGFKITILAADSRHIKDLAFMTAKILEKRYMKADELGNNLGFVPLSSERMLISPIPKNVFIDHYTIESFLARRGGVINSSELNYMLHRWDKHSSLEDKMFKVMNWLLHSSPELIPFR